MTAQQVQAAPAPVPQLTVINGGKSRHMVAFKWIVMLLVAVGIFLSLVFVRTSLDASMYQIDVINRQIEEQKNRNQLLQLELTRLASPLVILPAAEELGLVLPERVVSLAATQVDTSNSVSGENVQNDDRSQDLSQPLLVP